MTSLDDTTCDMDDRSYYGCAGKFVIAVNEESIHKYVEDGGERASQIVLDFDYTYLVPGEWGIRDDSTVSGKT